MKCKHCKNEIPEGSVFCLFCGEKTVREKKKKKEIKVPAPKILPSGSYHNRLLVDGETFYVTEPTEAEYYAKARAIKAGILEEVKKGPRTTLDQCLESYISKRENVLSPATILGYQKIRKNRFKKYQNKMARDIDFQKMINEESKTVSPKTIKNSWRFVGSALKEQGFKVDEIRLPQVAIKDLPWLDYKQIEKFLESIQGHTCEIPALLALHGLRRSEIFALTKDSFQGGRIHVSGAVVKGPNHKYYSKETNKTKSSTREVPIFIPRLQELLDTLPAEKPLFTMKPEKLYDRVNEACRRAGLPEVGVHGLRRSFCSLCYHLGLSELETMALGGWSDYSTMRTVYTKLSKSDFSEGITRLKAHFADEIDDESKKRVNEAI